MHNTSGANKQAVIITGAARGLGEALCAEFLKCGHVVVGVDEAPIPKLGSTDRFIRFQGEAGSVSFAAFVFGEVYAAGLEAHTLFNAARIEDRGDFLTTPPDIWLRSMQVHFDAAVIMTHFALRDMAQRGVGRVIMVGSYSDMAPPPMQSSYSVSKGSLRLLTRSLVADISDRMPNILFNDWMPGALAGETGVEDGIALERAAIWGVNLAGLTSAALNGVEFIGAREKPAPKSLKRRIIDKIRRCKGRSMTNLEGTV